MPRVLNELGRRVAQRVEAPEWAATQATALADESRNLPDWKLDQLSAQRAEGALGTDMERRIAACAYELGIGRGDVRSVLQVVLRDALIVREGRTPPAPQDGGGDGPHQSGEIGVPRDRGWSDRPGSMLERDRRYPARGHPHNEVTPGRHRLDQLSPRK